MYANASLAASLQLLRIIPSDDEDYDVPQFPRPDDESGTDALATNKTLTANKRHITPAKSRCAEAAGKQGRSFVTRNRLKVK